MQRVLGVVIALLIAAAVVGIVTERHRGTSAESPGAPLSTTVPDATVIVLRPDQARISGTVDTASFDGASLSPLRLPLTVTAGVRGSTRARITGGRQNGADVTITWDGGQPLPINGTGGLDVSGAHLDVTHEGLTWLLDGAPRPLQPGRYELGATVAVGTSGLATPRDGTAFDATSECALSTVDGATVHLVPSAVHLEGPGFLDLHGQLQVETANGVRTETHVRFGPGSYVVDLTPAGGGAWSLRSLVQGPLGG